MNKNNPNANFAMYESDRVAKAKAQPKDNIYIGKTDGALVDVNGFYIGTARKHEIVKRYNSAPELLRQLKSLCVQLESAGMIIPPGVRAAIAKAE